MFRFSSQTKKRLANYFYNPYFLFSVMATQPSPRERLTAIRAQLKLYNVDAFVQGTEDAHQSEYVSTRDERLGYLSGFSGSAGTLIVTHDQALLWTDGRYFIQVILTRNFIVQTVYRQTNNFLLIGR